MKEFLRIRDEELLDVFVFEKIGALKPFLMLSWKSGWKNLSTIATLHIHKLFQPWRSAVIFRWKGATAFWCCQLFRCGSNPSTPSTWNTPPSDKTCLNSLLMGSRNHSRSTSHCFTSCSQSSCKSCSILKHQRVSFKRRLSWRTNPSSKLFTGHHLAREAERLTSILID